MSYGMNGRLLIQENGAIWLANITMTNLTIAHFSEEKNYLSAILLLKMSEIKGTVDRDGVLPASTAKNFKANGLDLVQRINDEQNANLKENEIELIQDRTQFCY